MSRGEVGSSGQGSRGPETRHGASAKTGIPEGGGGGDGRRSEALPLELLRGCGAGVGEGGGGLKQLGRLEGKL